MNPHAPVCDRVLCTWPPEAGRLTRRIALLEVEASFAVCNIERRERLLLEASRLTIELEAIKARVVAGEVRA